MKKLIPFAYVSKTHGLKGQLQLICIDKKEIDLPNFEVAFINQNNQQTPYFIEECRATKSGYIIKLEGIQHLSETKAFINQIVYCDEALIIENKNLEFLNYQVFEQTHGNIGYIEDIEDSTHNVLLRIKHPSGKEVILPFNDQFVTSINKKEKQIIYKVPEGLIELYI